MEDVTGKDQFVQRNLVQRQDSTKHVCGCYTTGYLRWNRLPLDSNRRWRDDVCFRIEDLAQRHRSTQPAKGTFHKLQKPQVKTIRLALYSCDKQAALLLSMEILFLQLSSSVRLSLFLFAVPPIRTVLLSVLHFYTSSRLHRRPILDNAIPDPQVLNCI